MRQQSALPTRAQEGLQGAETSVKPTWLLATESDRVAVKLVPILHGNLIDLGGRPTGVEIEVCNLRPAVRNDPKSRLLQCERCVPSRDVAGAEVPHGRYAGRPERFVTVVTALLA